MTHPVVLLSFVALCVTGCDSRLQTEQSNIVTESVALTGGGIVAELPPACMTAPTYLGFRQRVDLTGGCNLAILFARRNEKPEDARRPRQMGPAAAAPVARAAQSYLNGFAQGGS